MELQQLKYFQAVAQLEHMTKAAEKLNITQPSLSITIARLEESLGVPLFDRFGRQIRLNQFGKAFLRRVERSFAELEEGVREVKDLAGLEYGTVSLAATNLTFLPDLLSSFLSLYPHIKFQLIQDTTIRMQHLLENGDVDFCITSPPISGSGINTKPLYNENIVVVVPKSHRLAERNQIDLLEVAEESFVSLKEGYGIRSAIEELCRAAGFTPNIAFEVTVPSLVASLVRSGVGIAFMPENAWQGELADRTSRLYIEKPAIQRIISISWLDRRYFSEASRQFKQFVIDYFKGE